MKLCNHRSRASKGQSQTQNPVLFPNEKSRTGKVGGLRSKEVGFVEPHSIAGNTHVSQRRMYGDQDSTSPLVFKINI